MQPPPGKRYVRSFLFSRRIDAPFARIHLIPRTLLVLCLSAVQLRAIDAVQPDLVGVSFLWGVSFLLFLLSGMHARVARLYFLLTVPALLSLFTTWLLFNPVPGKVTFLEVPLYSGTLVPGLAAWEAFWIAIVAVYFWRTRKILGGILLATLAAILLVNLFHLPQWTFASVHFFHSLTVLVSDRSLLVAVTKVIGYSGMVLVTIALVVSSRDVELIGTMRQMHLPQPVIFFMSTVFRTLDLALADYETIHQAQVARAINARPRSLVKRLRDMGSIAIPMVAAMIRRSSEIGDALLARGYRLGRPNADFYETSSFREIDWITLVVCLALFYLAIGPHLNVTVLLQRWF